MRQKPMSETAPAEQVVRGIRRKVATEQQATIIAVTHDDKIFERFDRIFHLRDGRLEHEP